MLLLLTLETITTYSWDIDCHPRDFDQYIITLRRIELFRKVPLETLPTAGNDLGEDPSFQDKRDHLKTAHFLIISLIIRTTCIIFLGGELRGCCDFL